MEKYEQHGLTKMEDDILGGFGDDPETDMITLHMYSTEHRAAINSMVRKQLLDRHIKENETIQYILTPKGRRLWRVRAAEESEGLSETD